MFCPNPECPDLIESGVRGEYVEGISQCPTCQTLLVTGLAIDNAEALRLVEGDVDVETVYVTADGTEAVVIRSMLEASGIPFVTNGDADQQWLGLGWAGVGVVGRGGVSFQVRSGDVAAAKELLESRELVEDQEV